MYKRIFFSSTLLLLLAPVQRAQMPADYYDSAAGLSRDQLREALRVIINDHTVHSYNDAHGWVDILDEDPADPGRVLLIYSDAVAEKTSWPDYNREHLWPQSMGAKRRPVKSDMHHIFAADQNVNSSRGNKHFNDCLEECRSHPEAPRVRYDSSSWEPPDGVKGDIARALFYMDVRYSGDGNEPDLVLREEAPMPGCNCMGSLSALLEWHQRDPVDDRERARNDVIFSDIQGNRNPFVDHPEWVSSIWGGTLTDADLTSDQVPTMAAHFIDVGQGDATLLEFPCGAILIDAGGQNASTTAGLVSYLSDFFDRRTDLERILASIIITHNHVDHTRALREVVESGVTVERFIENGQRGGFPEGDRDVSWLNDLARQPGSNIVALDVDYADIIDQNGYTNEIVDPLSCPGVDPKIRILSADRAMDPGWDRPGEDKKFGNKNNHSIVIRIDFGKTSFLFTGDLEEPAIDSMVDFYEGTSMLDVDVHQVGHHGSYNGVTESLVEAITPGVAVISMSAWDNHSSWTAWVYGHPRLTAVETLLGGVTSMRPPKEVRVAKGKRDFIEIEMASAVYATGWDGTVRILADSNGTLSAHTER